MKTKSVSKSADKLKNYKRGLWAEYMSILYLMFNGYMPVKHRYKCPNGEIDLLVKKGNALVFVEVKYRKTHEKALESVSPQNQKRVRRAAEHYLLSTGALHKYGDGLSLRFDVVVVNPYFKCRHIKNAF